MAIGASERFRDRTQAGRLLGERVRRLGVPHDPVVLALPRGGVPVAAEVALALGAPLDVLVVRKLGVPGHEELAIGAIAPGVRVLNEALVRELGLSPEELEGVDARARAEAQRRERLYGRAQPPPAIEGRTAILVDDGLATGSTMLAAISSVRGVGPASVLVAVPVADPEVCRLVGAAADQVLSLLTPHPLGAVGAYYEDFSQTGDAEVRALLAAAREREA
jgi:predicted phosphoribosyltransferase